MPYKLAQVMSLLVNRIFYLLILMVMEMYLGENIKGVIVSGDQGYGEAYCKSGNNIAQQYKVPCLYKVENAGINEDIAGIHKLLK